MVRLSFLALVIIFAFAFCEIKNTKDVIEAAGMAIEPNAETSANFLEAKIIQTHDTT